ncbi:hypothetical protein [Microbacterium sp. T32]|uniref:hypothetical protein n=1 Tax=Microbacterium sp. T32 TaxID=1776083 RepID=UPI000A6AD2B7|nr:hypothetical protein [Microbacterium sp. T32]
MGMREIVEESARPIFVRIEEEIHRQGAVRFLGTVIVVSLGLFAAISPFGVTPALVSVGCFLVVVLLIVAISASSGTRQLREREQDLVRELAKFGEVLERLQLSTALIFKEQNDVITIAKNGDLRYARVVRLGASSAEIPHYVRSGFSAQTIMTEHSQRRVKIVAYHLSGSTEGVRIMLTTSWTKSTDGDPMLVAHAYIGEEVRDDDEVKFELTWPRACRDLREKKRSEPFTMRFKNRAYPLKYSVTLEDQAVAPVVNAIGPAAVNSRRDGNNWVCEYLHAGANVGDRVGFVLDLR